MSDVTLLLESVGCGEASATSASADLLPLVYDELRHLAAARMARESSAHTLQPTALVHEAWLRLVGDDRRRWQDRTHFFRAAALAMRRILVDHARHKAGVRFGGGWLRGDLDDDALLSATPADRLILLDEALTRLETENPDGARIVTLKFFGGFTNHEIADILTVTERTVERHWAYARASLVRLVRESETRAPDARPPC